MTETKTVGDLVPRVENQIDKRLVNLREDAEAFANDVDELYEVSGEQTEDSILIRHRYFLETIDALRSDVEYAIQRIVEEFDLDAERDE